MVPEARAMSTTNRFEGMDPQSPYMETVHISNPMSHIRTLFKEPRDTDNPVGNFRRVPPRVGRRAVRFPCVISREAANVRGRYVECGLARLAEAEPPHGGIKIR
jgi:hypothetical protein